MQIFYAIMVNNNEYAINICNINKMKCLMMIFY